MAQITSGFRAIFSNPIVYNLAQNLVGAEKARKKLVTLYFPPMQHLRMLDIGCGTAEILRHLPEEMNYHGFDASQEYIDQAEARFGHRGTFRAELVTESTIHDIPPFDLVLAFGLLHHLEDHEAHALFQLAHAALTPSGKLITIDPTYISHQQPIAKWLISKDRGQNIRTPQGYEQLAHHAFNHVTVSVRDDMLHIPYHHTILECTH